MKNRSSKIGLRKTYEADARKQIWGRYVTYDRGLDDIYSLLKPALRYKIEERQREVLSEIAKENLNGRAHIIDILENPKLANALANCGRTKMQNYRPTIIHGKLKILYEILHKHLCKKIYSRHLAAQAWKVL